MFLFHVQRAKSFEELHTYEVAVMTSFKEACRARNLLEDEEFRSYLCEDFEFHTSEHQSVNLALHNKADQLHAHNMTLMSIGLPESAISHAYVQMERQKGERLMSMLNPEQRIIFDAVIHAIQNVGKAILCPKNEDSLKVNEHVLARFPHQNVTYFSADSIISEDQEERNNFQLDFINGITSSGMPPHVLNLKVGAIIMLLRNLNPSFGLCNGTRFIIRRLMSNVIDAEILIGHTNGSHAFIPRITFGPSDSNLPFQIQRLQFPVRLGFAININKSQ
ncbi:ATP-dependent DNA helicase [Trichonephila clavipes]|nr:ATP-dependent DNA helicase [Trichonephila clavipes]